VAARPRSRRAHLILGEDSYLRQEIRTELLAAVPEGARAFAVQEFSLARTSLDAVRRHATTPTLLSPLQVLILRDAGGLGEEEVEKLGELLDSLPDFTLLLFEEEKLDKRTRIYQLLARKCDAHSADSPPDALAQRKVEQLARELGLRLTRARAEELVFAVGTDLGTLRGEVEKLRAYAGEGKEVTSEDLAAVAVAAREFEIFDLVDLIVDRRRQEALKRLRRLLEQGNDPIPIVGLLAWLYRQLLVAHSLPAGLPPPRALEQLGGPRERREQLLRLGRKLTRPQLREAFAALAEADDRLKASPPDRQAVAEMLIIRLTQPAAAPAPAR
jgi:DNA polymerase-3 subunit delta